MKIEFKAICRVFLYFCFAFSVVVTILFSIIGVLPLSVSFFVCMAFSFLKIRVEYTDIILCTQKIE